jgi:hypothetical protein
MVVSLILAATTLPLVGGCGGSAAVPARDGDAAAAAVDAALDAKAPLPALLFTSSPTTWPLSGHNAGDYLYAPDPNVVVDGAPTARFEQNAADFPDGGVDLDGSVTSDTAWAPASTANPNIGTYIGMRVRMRAKIRTENVTVGAGIWFRIDAAASIAALCNMTNPVDTRIKGTQNFTEADCVLDVPSNATAFVFGAILAGPGTAWFGLATFEQVGTDVPVSPRAL